MTIRLKKILLPTDFSDYSTAATKYACELAAKFGAEVVPECRNPASWCLKQTIPISVTCCPNLTPCRTLTCLNPFSCELTRAFCPWGWLTWIARGGTMGNRSRSAYDRSVIQCRQRAVSLYSESIREPNRISGDESVSVAAVFTNHPAV